MDMKTFQLGMSQHRCIEQSPIREECLVFGTVWDMVLTRMNIGKPEILGQRMSAEGQHQRPSGMREPESGVYKGRTKGSDIPVIGENSILGQPAAPGELPPLPSFSSNLNPTIAKVVVVINGAEREGVVDHTGRIQLKSEAPEYYSIASDDDRQSLPRFGEGGKPLPRDSPFSPEAASPFGRVAATPERSSPVEELVTAQPQVPPPPPPPA